MSNTVLAIRNETGNKNHHLWNNNGTWFVHYTIYPSGVTKQRIRKSLKTKSEQEARERRDLLFADLRSSVRR
ncbi:MAG: hypothetical protein RL095_2770 [Verrucomicrobiota bacterium]|jgi:hypothetical protein